MAENENITLPPDIVNLGAGESQTKSNEAAISPLYEGMAGGGLNQYPLTTVVHGITEFGIKGSSAMALLFASTKRIETDLIDERIDNKRLTSDCETWKERYFEAKENNSVLKERLRGAERIKTLQSVFLTLGGLMSGVGIRNLIQEVSGISVALTLIGMCFLISGWFWPNQFSKGDKS
jgi:hypothetical protein